MCLLSLSTVSGLCARITRRDWFVDQREREREREGGSDVDVRLRIMGSLNPIFASHSIYPSFIPARSELHALNCRGSERERERLDRTTPSIPYQTFSNTPETSNPPTRNTKTTGGQANVRLCTQIETNKKFACKFYDLRYMSMKSKSDYLKFMKRLDAEIKIMRQCDHKNIVKFETSITMKDTMCLLMEYLDGEELFDVIANGGAMKEEEAIPIVRQMLSALAYLHERKIMHRDIKPENIMLVKKDGKRVVKLIDFGYGKLVSKSLAQTQVGTREYQAPEVNPINRAYGSGDTYSFAADVFSLGAVVYVFFSPSLSLSHTHSLTLANSLTRSNSSSSHTHTHTQVRDALRYVSTV